VRRVREDRGVPEEDDLGVRRCSSHGTERVRDAEGDPRPDADLEVVDAVVHQRAPARRCVTAGEDRAAGGQRQARRGRAEQVGVVATDGERDEPGAVRERTDLRWHTAELVAGDDVTAGGPRTADVRQVEAEACGDPVRVVPR